jgi:heme-degrading monooxygenase HmoA
MKLRSPICLIAGLLILIGSSSVTAQIGQSSSAIKQRSVSQANKVVIARIWHGRTRVSKADEYYEYLKEAGIKKIRGIAGNLGVQVLRRTVNDITEFTVISYWESIDAIRRFAGADIEKTHNLPKDPEYLIELEPKVAHYEVVLDEWKHR